MTKLYYAITLLFLLSMKIIPSYAGNNDSITYEQMGGIYYAYHYDSTATRTPAPEGFTPFYISHYNRHGSRWLPEDKRYQLVLEQFADTTNLTALGKDVLQRLTKIWKNAEGRGGDLTAVGAKQLSDIASRMYMEWNDVFKGNADVSARSSISGRCIMSMTNFLLKLQALNPNLKITAEANRRFMDYIAYSSPEEESLIASVPREIKTSPDRLMKSLFIHPERIHNPMNLLSELHAIASDMQNVQIGVSLYDIFTPEEIKAVYDASNLNMWTCNSHNPISKGIPERSAISLWRNIVESADSAISKGSPQATLRFSHDTSLYRLYTLLGLLNDERRMDRIIPMGANFIMVFYHNAKKQTLVKFLINEHEIKLPIISNTAPYYDWNQVKAYYNHWLSSDNAFIKAIESNGSLTETPKENEKLRIAFISDAHVQDIEKHPELIRSMTSEIHSTRLFNENIFAFRAALEDVRKRGIKLVVLPGDLTDNGQRVNLNAVRSILDEYTEKYDMRFFVTTGNHDPSRPNGEETVSGDFISEKGEPVRMASSKGMSDDKDIVINPSLHCCGYKDIMKIYDSYGMAPRKDYIFWSTPFSKYSYDEYSFKTAIKESSPEYRHYTLCDSITATDATYLVEPVKGLWLLAIDGSVYLPKYIRNGKQEYEGSSTGYNNTLRYKTFLIPWIRKIADEAHQRGKTLIAFCHYPAIDFHNGASTEITKWLGNNAMNMKRIPDEDVASALLDAGVRIHFAGHMHLNNTAAISNEKGQQMFNIQIPSTAAYMPAYKILTIEDSARFKVQTIVLDSVPGFRYPWQRYENENSFNKANGKELWNIDILKSENYADFCNRHFLNLVKERYIRQDFTHVPIDNIVPASAQELMTLATGTECEYNMSWNGIDFITDIYRLAYAGSLALRNITAERMEQYRQLSAATKNITIKESPTLDCLRHLCILFDYFSNGMPDKDFVIDFEKR
ncbi:MAG: metallophosphoesterase [Prevotellaceae bacterium]|nr:metallophosphoesterase [Prevotellaceae bacterium]